MESLCTIIFSALPLEFALSVKDEAHELVLTSVCIQVKELSAALTALS